LTKPLKAGAACRISFQWTGGSKGLDVKNVRLEAGKFKLIDAHVGFTGGVNRKNLWTLKIPKNAPATGWRLMAEIKGSHGTQSSGTIMIGDGKVQGVVRKLPNGKTFSNPEELKQQLLAGYRNQVIDNVVHRVLAYALGRHIEPVDRPALRKIKEQIEQNGHRMTAVIEEVVLSYPFRHKESR
jgi:hypothetical protein